MTSQCPIVGSFPRFLRKLWLLTVQIHAQIVQTLQIIIILHTGNSTQLTLKIHNILLSMGDGKVTALTLLDLSTTSDTIDHAILYRRFDDWFGRRSTGLKNTGRCRSVKLGY